MHCCSFPFTTSSGSLCFHSRVVHVFHCSQVTQPKQCLALLQQKTFVLLFQVRSERMKWFSWLHEKKKIIFLGQSGPNKEAISFRACPYIKHLLHCYCYRWWWPSLRTGTLASIGSVSVQLLSHQPLCHIWRGPIRPAEILTVTVPWLLNLSCVKEILKSQVLTHLIMDITV